MDSASFLHLQRNIFQSIKRRMESETLYKDFLQKIFNTGDLLEAAVQQNISTSTGELENDLLQKGGVHDDPQLESEVHIEHLPIPKVFGREHEMRKLLHKCCNLDEEERIQLSAIPIVGPAGVGKTTLARLIYEDELVKKHFEIQVWVELDGPQLNLHRAAQQILKSTMGMACSDDELDEMVGDILLGRRCLIVFDGVDSMTSDVWLHMNKYWFGSVYLGSILLITTPSKDVANLVSDDAFKLKQLLPDDGLSLYRYHSIGNAAIMKDASRNIAALCGFIPLLLKLVGGVMRYDDKLRHLFLGANFSNAISLPTFDESVVVLLCVWALTPQLTRCLAFCVSFPEGYVLDREIINMWTAHDLVKPSPENNLRDIGDFYIHQLICRSFIIDIARNEYGDITKFRVPGLIHKIMHDAGIVWKGKVGEIGSISEDAHQFSLNSEEREDVRALILSATIYSGATSLDNSFLDFQELQSLDLSCSGIRNLSDDMCALTELRYLNLSYTLIERLPDSITDLSRLQTLDLSWCYHFKVLPKAMGNLKYMSHLDLSNCESLSYLPYGIALLESLTSMPLFFLGKGHDSARLGELGQLNQLRGRLDIRNLENVVEISEAHEAKINKKKKLRCLGLCWCKDVDPDSCFQVLKSLKPNRHLRVLDITGYTGSTFPLWISFTTSLTKILIADCRCKKLPLLGKLPHLKELHLKGMTNIQDIGQEFYGAGVTDAFPSLEQLGLYDMPKLVWWSGAVASGEVCRSLKTLTIEGCPRLLYIPTFRNLIDLIVCTSSVKILLSLDGPPPSLLIKNMELEEFLDDPVEWRSLKKLILSNCTWYLGNAYLFMSEFTELEHLGIAHCPQLRNLRVRTKNSFQKLHVVDCPHLESIYFFNEATKLTELVVDGCPSVYCRSSIDNLHSLTKLIIRGSDNFLSARNFIALEKLEYLLISECPLLERKLETKPSLISHIQCVILGNRKVQYKDRTVVESDE